jgi:GT2 family glycosyltransferase
MPLAPSGAVRVSRRPLGGHRARSAPPGNTRDVVLTWCGVSISAYVPTYNAAATIRRTVESLLAQTIAPDEIIVVDDGSTDAPVAAVLAGFDVTILKQENLGRGAARARAMGEAAHEFVLSCDATIVLQPRFVETAMRWFDDARTAAVFGPVRQAYATTLAERWRGRHLFKMEVAAEQNRRASLATGGTIVRASAVRHAGGYNPRLRHTEDADLGARLLAAGFDVIFDPHLAVTSIAKNTLAEVLERHWRWNAGADERISWREYARGISYSVKHMARMDLTARDPLGALVSLSTPHYRFWRSLWRTGSQAGHVR